MNFKKTKDLSIVEIKARTTREDSPQLLMSQTWTPRLERSRTCKSSSANTIKLMGIEQVLRGGPPKIQRLEKLQI